MQLLEILLTPNVTKEEIQDTGKYLNKLGQT